MSACVGDPRFAPSLAEIHAVGEQPWNTEREEPAVAEFVGEVRGDRGVALTAVAILNAWRTWSAWMGSGTRRRSDAASVDRGVRTYPGGTWRETWIPRFTAELRDATHPFAMRSRSHSAAASRMERGKRPAGVLESICSSTEMRSPPAFSVLSIAARAPTFERAKRLRRATMIPCASPACTRSRKASNVGLEHDAAGNVEVGAFFDDRVVARLGVRAVLCKLLGLGDEAGTLPTAHVRDAGV